MQPDRSIRKCQTCGVDKPRDQFESMLSNPGGRSIICRECVALANHEVAPVLARAPKNREWSRASTCRKYGITEKQYLELLRRQGGMCAICRKEQAGRYLAIDHDHRCCCKNSSCGKCVRGLLCSRCNQAIGLLSDDSDRLENAIDYLEGNDRMKATERREKKAKKRRSRKLPPYLTIPEKDRFFKAIDDVRNRAIFRLLYHHGLRASEIGKLQMSDYRQGSTLELDRIYIHRLKGSVSGECAVVPTAAFAVRAWIRQRGIRAGVLFPSRNRTAISRNRIFELMQKYCAAAEIPAEKSHPHCLKHTCCTHLISDQKESIMDVRAHVGHVNIKSTMVYAELMDEATEERARRLRGWK